MVKSGTLPSKDPASRWILLGIPVLCIIGFPMHFIYEWSGNLPALGILAPINESIWEHLKLTFWPMLIWWLVGYFILSKRNKFSPSQWFASCTAAMLICPLIIVSFYYTYTGAFGIESLILDIFSLFLGVTIAQCMAYLAYKYVKYKNYCLYISITLLALMVIAFTVFTFNPPHIPLFQDSLTGKYGI